MQSNSLTKRNCVLKYLVFNVEVRAKPFAVGTQCTVGGSGLGKLVVNWQSDVTSQLL
jgi:hypothetical protein